MHNVAGASGESGDLSDAKGPSGQKPAWAIPKGVVSFHHSPGHAPGHVRLIHTSLPALPLALVIVCSYKSTKASFGESVS